MRKNINVTLTGNKSSNAGVRRLKSGRAVGEARLWQGEMTMNRTMLLALVIALAGATATIGSGCTPSEANAAEKPEAGSNAATEPSAPQVSKAANVKVIPITAEAMTREVMASGVTKSDRDITYSAEVSGRVDSMRLEPGNKVRKGQVLARIDYTALSAQSEQAQASLELARVTHERLDALSGENLVSRQRIDEAKAGLLQAQAANKIAASTLGKSTVRAMYDGVVSETYSDQGEFVGPGTPMLRVVDMKNLIVEARFAESEISLVSQGAAAKVRIEALGEEFPARVETVVPTADPESKTFRVRLRLEKNDDRVLVGMAARVLVSSETAQAAVLIPQDAVIESGSTRTVFVAESGIAKARVVTLGPSAGSRVSITEGLIEGDKLIVIGQRDLKDQQPINIVN